MRKLFLALLGLALMFSCFAQAPEKIKLPEPQKTGGMPLYEALNNRQTNRNFSSKQLSEQELSNLLWCANGVNRGNGKRTAPSARNAQEIDIYVATANGTYFYNADGNMLEMVVPEDHRKEMTGQSTVVEAPVTLIFIANYDKMEKFNEEAREFYGATDCGYVSQNVYLYCAANKLNTVVLGGINRDFIRDILQVNGKAILIQPVGYPKSK